jgi:hypothetical protein
MVDRRGPGTWCLAVCKSLNLRPSSRCSCPKFGIIGPIDYPLSDWFRNFDQYLSYYEVGQKISYKFPQQRTGNHLVPHTLPPSISSVHRHWRTGPRYPRRVTPLRYTGLVAAVQLICTWTRRDASRRSIPIKGNRRVRRLSSSLAVACCSSRRASHLPGELPSAPVSTLPRTRRWSLVPTSATALIRPFCATEAAPSRSSPDSRPRRSP